MKTEIPRFLGTLGRKVTALKYVRWTQADGPLLPGLVEEWTEVDDDGRVVRDIGFDAPGRVAYKWPDPGTKDDYGPWDMALVEVSATRDLVDPLEFERAWATGPEWVANVRR